MKILLTGSAGFIGYHLAKQLIAEGFEVIGLDSINDYYQVSLKYDRLATAGIAQSDIQYNQLAKSSLMAAYSFVQLQLEDKKNLEHLFITHHFDTVINLAAQAGVRYSITNPSAYIDSNIVGFANLLECSRHHNIRHFVYASSSSVYGLNGAIPFATSQSVDHPISLYAATKKSNELMAHVYSHLFGLPTTGLRFFTVYGPWGRPDMALFQFTKAIIDGESIQVFNNGEMERDFTYIDDVVDGLVRVLKNPARVNAAWSSLEPDPSTSQAPYQIYNIGNSTPIKLTAFIDAIVKKLGKDAKKIMMPMQPGDLPRTYADISPIQDDLAYKPGTSLQEGVNNFIDWYVDYFNISPQTS